MTLGGNEDVTVRPTRKPASSLVTAILLGIMESISQGYYHFYHGRNSVEGLEPVSDMLHWHWQ